MTGMLTQVRNVLEGAPLDDIILVLAEDGELQRSDAWSAVLHHIRHAESSGADVPVLSEAQLHIMVPAFLQDIKLQNSGAVQHEILFQSAIRCVGYCLYRIQFLSNASRKQIHSILDAIILVLKNGIQAKFVYLAVWAMAIHRVEVESVLEELCDDLLKGLITSMRFGDEVEAVSKDFFAGLHKLFRKIPNLAVTKSKIWFPAVFETLLADDRKVVEFANAFFPSVTEHFVALNSQYASEIKNLTNSEIGPIIELFHAKTEHENLFTAWGHLVAMLGSSLHRSPNLNTILKIVEIGFNSEVTPKRVAAHKAWRRLILNFAQDGHLRNPKRTGLILLPILNGFKYEKMHVAKMECARTFMFLLVHLSHFAPLRSFMKTSVLPVVQMARTDSKLIDMVLLASILNVTASSTPASEKPSLRQSYIEIDPKVPGALLQRIRPNMPAATWTAEDLSVFLDIIEISVDRWATYPQMRGKMLQLWAQAIQFINRSMESSRRDLAPLAAGLNLIWKILQKPEASDHAHALAETFEITLPEDANEVTDEDRETQYDHAKTAMKLLSNIRRMLSPNTKGQEHMTNIAKTISAQYQLALAHVDPLATRPHPRAQNLMEKLSSDGHERVGDENGTPRKKKHASLDVHFVPVAERKRKDMDTDDSVLTPKQMEKRRQVNNVPVKMFNALDRSQSGLQEPIIAEEHRDSMVKDENENQANDSHNENQENGGENAEEKIAIQATPRTPAPDDTQRLKRLSETPLVFSDQQTFSNVVDLLKTRIGDLPRMHPRELTRTQISLHNIMGEIIRVINANIRPPADKSNS